MVSPLDSPVRNPPDRLNSTADDLQRLESSIQWIKREGMLARLEAGHRAPEEIRKLPRVAVLPPVSGIPPVDIESSRRTRETSTSLLSPPPIGERVKIQLPRRPHRHRKRGAFCLLIASVIGGAIAYHVSAGGAFPAWEPAQASAFEHNQQELPRAQLLRER